MALIFVGKLAYPPTTPEFNSAPESDVSYDDVAGTFVVTNRSTGVSVTIGQAKVSAAVAALNRTTLALAQYIALPIGTMLSVLDYNATGKGVTIQKISLVASTYADWMVVATEAAASTGHISEAPSA
jgi:hypothetical protein